MPAPRETEIQPLPQNLPNRFETFGDVKIAPRISKVKPQIKLAPLDKIIAIQLDIIRKFPALPARPGIMSKTRIPSIFTSTKKFLLPSTC
jgi:hypothetical protein